MDPIQVLHIALALVTLAVPAVGIVISIAQRTKHPDGPVGMVIAGCGLLTIGALASLAWLLAITYASASLEGPQIVALSALSNSVGSLATAFGVGLLIAAAFRRRRGAVPPMRPVPPPPPGPAQAQWGQWGAPRS
jgi:hypothetical protein